MIDTTETLLVEIRASLEGFSAQMSRATGIVEENTTKMAAAANMAKDAIGRLGMAFGAYLGADAIKHIVDANIDFQRMFYTLEAGTGSAQGATEQIDFLSKASMALGINLKEAGQQFGMMLAAAQGQNISVQSLQGLYLGLAKTFDIMHASTYRQQRVMYAFNEMISMGTVRTRQFQRMLSQDLPGVPFLHIAAEQMGYTEAKLQDLIKSGQITAQQMIPAMAAGLNQWANRSGALSGAVTGLNATINRFKTAIFEAEKNAGDGFVGALSAVIDQTTKVMQVLDPLNAKIKETGSQFVGLRDVVNSIVTAFEVLVATVKTDFTLIFAIIRTDIQLIVAGFREIIDAAHLVAHAFDLLLQVIGNFVYKTREGFANIGSALKDVFTGHLGEAKDALTQTGAAFKSAFTGGDLSSQFKRLSDDLSNMGHVGKTAVDDIKANWIAAASEISDAWSSASKKIGGVWSISPGAASVPKMPEGAGSVHSSGSGPSLTDGIKSYAMEAMQTQLMAAKAGSMERLGIAREEVKEAALLYGEQSKQYQEALRRMNAAYKAYEKDKAETARKAQQEQLKHYEKLYQQTYQRYMQLFSIVTQAVDQSVKGMIRGTITAHQAVRNIFQSILGEFIDMCIKQLTQWIATQIAMTSVQEASTAQRQAIEDAANKQTLLKTAAVAAKKILMKMWEVMASVYSAIAGIPYVGPFLAPAMAIAAGALVASWAGRVASAAGGWANVPEDQMAMIHKNEMVLPAPLAERIRGMAGGGGGTGAGSIHLHVNAVDGDSVRRLFLDNENSLAEALMKAARNGRFIPA